MSESQCKVPGQEGFSKPASLSAGIRQPRKRILVGGIRLLVISTALCSFTQAKNDQPTASKVASADTSSDSILRNWTSFRGPGSNGHAVQANPPLSWNVGEGKNIRWKAKVPKPGKNSPVNWGNRLFLTGADESSSQIYCFNADTGELLWQYEADGIPGSSPKEKLPNVMDTCGLAAPTMTTNGRYVAAIFATGDLVCANMDGERVWAKNLGVPNNPYGHASSLISRENLLFVQYDQTENSKLLAFDLASGELAWQVKRGSISWSSPILINNKGKTELILTNCKTVDSYDPKTGKLLWHVPGLNGEVAPSAAYANGVVYVANENSVAAAIEVGAHSSEPKVLWAWDEILPDAASPLANEQYVIIPSGYGIIDCLDGTTGKVFWEHEFDGGFYSSPILVNDRVYAIDLSGRTQIFKMGDQFELLGTAEIGEEAYATPAFVGKRIYIRGATHLFCIEEQNGNDG